MKHSSWGKYPLIEGREFRYKDGMDFSAVESWIPRGLARSYGDSSLASQMVSSLSLNRFLNFDAQTGVLELESGVSFEEILKVFVPQGWFPPVTPGTKFVTMGGAIASDVHGKNHHKEGSISRHLISFTLLLPSGEIVECSRKMNARIWHATIGGMGLTGMLLSLKLQLKKIESSMMNLRSLKARNLDEILDFFEQYHSTTYSVAWIDCMAHGHKMGRSILMLGEHATAKQLAGNKHASKPLSIPVKKGMNIPIDLPGFALNQLSIKAFNFAFYHKQLKKDVNTLQHYEGYFYPLDALDNWNRIYGKRGFTQYQFVIPFEAGRTALADILKRIADKGLGSFLAVLKTLGEQEEGMIPFPMPGYTLALDFPITPKLFPFLDELDKVVAGYGGRLYLTKDVRMSPEMARLSYPRWDEFVEFVHELDPERRIQSLQSQRLGI